jgi:hypothetical protein
MKSARVYSRGIVHCSVCVPAEWSPSRVEAEVNRDNPTGLDSPWTISTELMFKSGQSNPCPCETAKGHLHYLMVC